MSELNIDQERYAIEHIKRAIQNPFAYGLTREETKKLKEVLKRHEEHLRQLLEEKGES